MSSEVILFVDDEEKILRAIKRNLSQFFKVEIALGAEEALAALSQPNDYAVVVSDMDMPIMNGIELLSRIQDKWPDIVRIMLTGKADLQSTIEAVNKDNVFKFLTKPVKTEDLKAAIDSGIAQYKLRTLEKEMMEDTLQGSIKILTDILSIVKPELFGRVSRMKQVANSLAKHLKYPNLWEVDISALLSSVGFVSVPDSVIEKNNKGLGLTLPEKRMIDESYNVAVRLVGNIPRLETISTIIRQHKISYQDANKDGISLHPIARILKVASDYIELTGLSDEPEKVYKVMNTVKLAQYDPQVLAALKNVISLRGTYKLIEVPIKDLKEGMIFAKNVEGKYKTVLIPKGQEVTPSIKARLMNYALTAGIEEETVPVLIANDDVI